MKITFDPEANAAFIYLVPRIDPGEVHATVICNSEMENSAVILAFDDAGNVLGIEILGASKVLRQSTLDEAELLSRSLVKRFAARVRSRFRRSR